MPECFTCGEEIAFDKNIRSKTGKQIPLFADMQNTHGHDEEGNPVRQPLPSAQTQNFSNVKRSFSSPSTTTRVTEGGATLDTKRIFNQLKEMDDRFDTLEDKIDKITEKIEYNTQVDTDKLIGQLQIINDTITPHLRTQIKKGSDLYNNEQQKRTEDPLSINHGEKADKFESRRNTETNEFETTKKFEDTNTED